jgi:hypothetical protein
MRFLMERRTFRHWLESLDRFIKGTGTLTEVSEETAVTSTAVSPWQSARMDVQKLFNLRLPGDASLDAALHCGTYAGRHAEILLEAFAASDQGEDCRINLDVNRSNSGVQSSLEAARAADLPVWTGVSRQDPVPRRTSPGGPEEGG